MRKRILFLTLYDESGASSRLAIYQFLPFFVDAGYDVEVRPLIEGNAYKLLGALADSKSPLALTRVLFSIAMALPRRLSHINEARAFDAVVVQKDVLPLGLGWLLSRAQKNIVFEYDDPIWLPHPASGGQVKVLGPILSAYRKHCLIGMHRISRAIVVDSPKMLEFSKRYCENSHLLHAGIDLSSYPVRADENSETAFGWIGSPSTTYLLSSLIPWLEELAEKRRFRLYNIGSSPLYSSKFSIENIPWTPENELKYLPRFTVGLLPVDRTEFNLCRLSRKWLVYSAAEVPTLAADTEMNRFDIENGVTGLLYEQDQAADFVAQAERLLADDAMRKSLGRAARAKIARELNLPIVGRRFVAMVEAAIGEPERRAA